MSVKIWTNPNDPNPADPTRYKIGTEGLEHGREGLSGFILELFRKAYPLLPVQSILGTLLVVGSVDVAVPTYGLWAGPGWNAGTRPPEGGTIEWETLPCYNNNIKNIENNPELNPDDCISLVDAICKAHDWRYSEADALYKNDSEGRENAKPRVATQNPPPMAT